MPVRATKDAKGGVHITATCDISGKPYTRATADGMFCDAADCVCERKSKGADETIRKMLETLDRLKPLDPS